VGLLPPPPRAGHHGGVYVALVAAMRDELGDFAVRVMLFREWVIRAFWFAGGVGFGWYWR